MLFVHGSKSRVSEWRRQVAHRVGNTCDAVEGSPTRLPTLTVAGPVMHHVCVWLRRARLESHYVADVGTTYAHRPEVPVSGPAGCGPYTIALRMDVP
jgi:hypothetical protein